MDAHISRVALLFSLSVCMLSHVWFFATQWTVASQATLSMEFPRQEYWSRLQFAPPGNIPDSGIEPEFPVLAGRLFTTEPPGEPYFIP